MSSRLPEKPDYGIDGPGVVRAFALLSVAFLAAALAKLDLHLGSLLILHTTWYSFGLSFAASALLMLFYAKVLKFHHRDRMLNMIRWRGDEHVLDVGTGRGLLLVGAARRLKTGRAVGIDIWNPVDLSGNSRERTEHNLRIEGVDALCELRDEAAQKMSFPDASFDVVLSNLCLHNIPSAAERDRACAEIVRVLKPGGCALISDYKHTLRYARQFRTFGLESSVHWSWATFPPLRIVQAIKPAP